MKSVFASLTVLLMLVFSPATAHAQVDSSYISFEKRKGLFPVAENGIPVPLLYPSGDEKGVERAFNNLCRDLEMVSGQYPQVLKNLKSKNAHVIVAGTVGRSAVIDDLVRRGKLNVSSIKDKWEGFLLTVVEKPFKGVDRAFIIAGSDRRGTIFGIYDLAEQIGMSPWHWWANVPAKKRPDIYFTGTFDAAPAVKYRGIFINDEQPALGGWVAENYGGFNHKFYEKVFELILRLKGNFLWPAMWGQSFYSDDPKNPQLADEMGVVIGTSHHEPMMRAHAEWQRNHGGAWNYNTNQAKLQSFWREGIERMGNNESIVTLAMRGDGDEPMSEESNVKLLQQIVQDQRKIIEDVTAKPEAETPQVWALYKEVQEYYERGMRVPDDVTLLLCDDNWGNIRKLPTDRERAHPGGYGIYYHFDYVGDPRNYKWINTNPLPRIWEQMHLAWEFGAREIWIVNVGDIKPMEFPIDFFLDMAFNPTLKATELDQYTRDWVEMQFPSHHREIARILSQYAKFNSRRKPELLGPDTFSPRLYSLVHYREAERVVTEYNALAERAQSIYEKLDKEYRDAYYQLILYPVKASANLNEFYYNVRLNHLYAKQGRASATTTAERAKALFEMDSLLTAHYNKIMSAGKWNHMMDQHHIGYKGWHDDFKRNTMPELKMATLLPRAAMGVVGEGSDSVVLAKLLKLPALYSTDSSDRYVEIFNRGTGTFNYTVEGHEALLIDVPSAEISEQQRLHFDVQWPQLPTGKSVLPFTIRSGTGDVVEGELLAIKVDTSSLSGFLESNGFISIEAPHFSRAVNTAAGKWHILPDHGRTGSSITTHPVTTGRLNPASGAPHVEYDVNFSSAGEVRVYAYFSPTIDFTGGDGLEYAISFDEGEPTIVNIHQDKSHTAWQESVKDNIRVSMSVHRIDNPGKHVLKFWRVDPGLVLQKIVIDTGGLKPSYLGPPESAYLK